MTYSRFFGVVSALMVLGIGASGLCNSALYGGKYDLSVTNFPDSFGVTTDPVFQDQTDHGTGPAQLTFDGVEEQAGGVLVNERAVVWEGQPGGITVYRDFDGLETDALDWEIEGEVVEFSFRSANGDYIAQEDPEGHSQYTIENLVWNGADAENPLFYPDAGFYFYYSQDGVPVEGYATTMDIGLAVGPHPFDDSVSEVVYIFYSSSQVDEVTEPFPGGLDIHGGTTQLDETFGSFALLADVMAVDPFDYNGKPLNGFHTGFLTIPPAGGGPILPADALMAGDADQNLDFNQLDIVKVSIANKYLSGQPATWGEGDWDGAPGGSPGDPPSGDGFFNQVDVIAALSPGHYLTGPYAALSSNPGNDADEQTSLVYDPANGELRVNAPASTNLTSIFVTSAGNMFIGDKPAVLDGPFDSFGADNIFKSTIGGSFGDLTFGNVLPSGLTADDVVADLTASGSLEGGGGLGDVDLIYVPEPSAMLLVCLAIPVVLSRCRRRRG